LGRQSNFRDTDLAILTEYPRSRGCLGIGPAPRSAIGSYETSNIAVHDGPIYVQRKTIELRGYDC